MALKKETIDKIAAILKLDPKTFGEALAATEEKDVEIPELQVFTTDELTTRDTNNKSEGIKTGKEIGAKEVRKAAGLDDGGSKDPAKIAEAIKTKAIEDAKINPDVKVVELGKQIETLKSTIQEKELEVTKAKEAVNGVQLDRRIFSALPKNRADVLTDDEYIGSVKNVFSITTVDGKEIVSKNGVEQRDPKTGSPIDLATAVSGYFTERKGWLAEAGAGGGGGRGAGDKGGGTGGAFTKKSQVIEHYEKQGISLNGAEGQKVVAELSKLAKENPDFDMNN